METRAQWYKPNLLYNIHYRPPTDSQPLKKTVLLKTLYLHKMVVDTIRFNPSVCTCGEHGCLPQYRMERKVRWINEEVDTAAAARKQNDEANKKAIEGRSKGKSGALDESDGRCECKAKDDKGEYRCDCSVDGGDGDDSCDGTVAGQASNGRADGDVSDDRCDGRAGVVENVIDPMEPKAMEDASVEFMVKKVVGDAMTEFMVMKVIKDAMAEFMVMNVIEDSIAEIMMTDAMVDVGVDEYDGRRDGRVCGEEDERRYEVEVNCYEGDGRCYHRADCDKGDDIRYVIIDCDKGNVRSDSKGNGDGRDARIYDSVGGNAGQGSNDDGVGVEDDDAAADDNRFFGSVIGHVDSCNYDGRLDAVEVDGRCNEMADSCSCGNNNGTRSDPHTSDTNSMWKDDTEEVLQRLE